VAALAVETMQQLCRQGQWAGARSLVR
jgi:hypothetical protein